MNAYRGVQYEIVRLADGRWRWVVSPPTSVQGLFDQAGEIVGEAADAVRAAQGAIEMQTRQFSG